ncbi:prepilin peptidase [Nakamurella deserti]|uniref:prepilin peptidase n=1 Tax=Nakamurella deserti TaxID=2164074 RepID=UPI000DBEA248|nr:A24 family peptidase [Nakamurella deserti]
MTPLLVVAALFGLAVGSFLNVVIHRVPAAMSLSRPGSHCPACDHPIRTRHNVPVVGWLVLRGRCADCRAPISVRYPLVELATAVLFVGIAWRLADLDLLPALPALLWFTAMGVSLTMIDLDVRRLPDAIVFPSYGVIAALLVTAAWIGHDPAALLRAAVGAVALFAGYFLLAFFYPGGMGFGDVKLAGIVGGVLGFLGYPVLLVGAFAAFFIGAFVGIAKVLVSRGTAGRSLAFGPFMIAGALLSVFVGPTVADVYSRLALGG